MKAIIQSYSPEEVERIARGEQTIKVCKTAPKDTPFKVYMYCTKEGMDVYGNAKRYVIDTIHILNENAAKAFEETTGLSKWNGKVVGDYVCEKVEECVPDYNPITQEFFYNDWEDCSADSLTSEEETAYGKGKPLYGLHISELKFYDKPKELTDFNKPCVDKYQYCQGCRYGSIILSADEEEYAMYHGGRYEYFETACHNYVTCPPRSWKYVEEL